MFFRPYSLAKTAILTLITVPVLLTTGCGVGASAPSSPLTVGTISGIAMGGQSPITSAAVTLYAAGKTGYGSAPVVLGTATTGAGGAFTIARNANTCTDPDQLYLVSSGGNPGSGTNSAAVLVEALGTCSSITTATSGLVINELTTISAAYALAGFADVTSGSSVKIGTSSTNAQGLTHAFANAANLTYLNGTVRATTVGGNGTVPSSVINSLGDALANCVNSTGSSSTGCTAILVAPPTGTTTATPLTTWQAALNWALYPGNNTAAVYNNQGATPPFLPNLASANDLTIGIPYYTGYKTGGTALTGFPWDIKADANDNIWISGQTSVGLTELNSTGTVLSPAGGWGSSGLQSASARGLAFDNLSPYNVWVGDLSGNVWAYNPTNNTTTQVALPTSLTVGGAATTVAKAAVPVAVDANNNVWYGTYAGTATATQTFGEIPSGTFAAQTTFTNSPLYPETTKGSYSLTVDAAHNTVWAGSQTGGNVYTFPTSGSSAAALTTAVSNSYAMNTIAQDGSGNTWVVDQGSGADKGSLYEFSSTSPSTTPTLVAAPTGASAGLYNPRGLAIDGIGRLFVISYSSSSSIPAVAAVVEYDPSLTTSSTPAGYLLNAASNGFAPVDNTGTEIIVGSGPRNATIDSTGSLWLSNGTAAGQPGAVQIFGIASPAVAPLSKGKYGVRP